MRQTVATAIALVLAVTAIALPFGGAWLLQADGAPVDQFAGTLFLIGTVVWLVAAASQVTRPSSTLSIGVGVSVVVYAAAFPLPSIGLGDDTYPGWRAFWSALMIVTDVWLANPAYLLGLIAARRGHGGTAFVLSALALALAVMHLDIGAPDPAITLGSGSLLVLPGYVLWVGSIGFLAAAGLTHVIERNRVRAFA